MPPRVLGPQGGPIQLKLGKDFCASSGREDFFLLLDLNAEACVLVDVGSYLMTVKEASLRTKPSCGAGRAEERSAQVWASSYARGCAGYRVSHLSSSSCFLDQGAHWSKPEGSVRPANGVSRNVH